MTTSPFVLRSVTLEAFSLAITPVSVSPFFVVTFHCQKLGSTSRLGSMTCARRAARPCAPMPFSGGPTSLFPSAPSLWQLEHIPVKRSLPFAASPGFSISGVSVAMMSLFALPAGLSVSRSAAA